MTDTPRTAIGREVVEAYPQLLREVIDIEDEATALGMEAADATPELRGFGYLAADSKAVCICTVPGPMPGVDCKYPHTDTPHEHAWQANGTVDTDRIEHSPSSVWDDLLYTNVLAVATCTCGATQRTRVGRKNIRRRGDKPGTSSWR